jgi:DNA-directed RNA polymerase subunit K/omega
VSKNETRVFLGVSRDRMSAQEQRMEAPGGTEEDTMLELDLLEQAEEKEAAKPQDPLATLYKHHPESILDYQETIIQKLPLQSIPPGSGESPDGNHKSQPFLTQYERTSILGFRTNQIAQGALPFVSVPKHIRNPLDIAKMELEQRRLPFIIKRPMPDGSFEYWRLSDLILI